MLIWPGNPLISRERASTLYLPSGSPGSPPQLADGDVFLAGDASTSNSDLALGGVAASSNANQALGGTAA